MVHKLVFSRTQAWMAGLRPPPCLVDQRLRVLNAHAHGEGLGLQSHANPLQHREGIACGMSRCEDEVPTGDPLAGIQLHSGQLVGFAIVTGVQEKVVHPTAEAHLTAKGLNARAQTTHHRGQLEGADVGAMDRENLGTGPTGH